MGPEVVAIAAIAAAGMSAVGTVMAGQQQAAAAAYNAQVEQQNAERARQIAKVEADDIRTAGQRTLGLQRAKLGALGLLPDEGSPYELLIENAANIELDAQRRIYRGEVEATGHLSQANLDSMKTSTTGSYLAAGGQLLGSGARAYELLNTPKKTG